MCVHLHLRVAVRFILSLHLAVHSPGSARLFGPSLLPKDFSALTVLLVRQKIFAWCPQTMAGGTDSGLNADKRMASIGKNRDIFLFKIF